MEPQRPYIRKPDGTCISLTLIALKTSPEEAAKREKFDEAIFYGVELITP